MVLLNELVPLKLPDFVGVVLDLLECEATQGRGGVWLRLRLGRMWSGENSLEDSYEQVEQQDVGKEQVDAKHDDGEPLGEGGHLVVVQHRAFWLQVIRAVNGALLYVKHSICRDPDSRFSLFLHHAADFQTQPHRHTTPSLTVNIRGKFAKYDAVRLVEDSTEDPGQAVVVVDQDALLGHAVCHHPDAQQEHEEEHVFHLEDNKNTDTLERRESHKGFSNR